MVTVQMMMLWRLLKALDHDFQPFGITSPASYCSFTCFGPTIEVLFSRWKIGRVPVATHRERKRPRDKRPKELLVLHVDSGWIRTNCNLLALLSQRSLLQYGREKVRLQQ